MVSFIETENSEFLPDIGGKDISQVRTNSELEMFKIKNEKSNGNRISMPLLKFDEMKKYNKRN